MPSPSARGDAGGRAWPVTPIAVVATVTLAAAIAASVALFPHRAARPLGGRLVSVRVRNALSSRCRLENGASEPIAYPCGSYLGDVAFRTEGASRRSLVAVSHEHRSCVLDEDTLETVLCRDASFEWVALDDGFVSVATYRRDGGGFVVAQRAEASGELREIDLPFPMWFDWSDPTRPIVVDGDGRRFRMSFGALVLVE